MTDLKICPKCEGTMSPGVMRQVGNYGDSPYVWAPEKAIVFHQEVLPAGSFRIRIYRCTNCAYLEMYAAAEETRQP